MEFYSPQGRACAAGQWAAGQGAAWPATLPETREGPATAPVTTAPPSTAPERRAGPTAGPARAAGPATGPLRAAGPRIGPANAAPGARRPDGAASAMERAATRRTAAKVRMFARRACSLFQAGGTVWLGGSGGCAVTWLPRSRFYTMGIVYYGTAGRPMLPPTPQGRGTGHAEHSLDAWPVSLSAAYHSIMRVGGDNGFTPRGPPPCPRRSPAPIRTVASVSAIAFFFVSFSLSHYLA